MLNLFDFKACRVCLAPETDKPFKSLFENAEDASKFDAIAEIPVRLFNSDFVFVFNFNFFRLRMIKIRLTL